MQDLKAPSPDVFFVLFNKHHWPIVGEAVTETGTSFFECGRMPKEVNNSLIVLIPKTQNPSSFNNFRLSLCNVVYKMISNLLVSKHRPLLHNLVSPYQSVFSPIKWIVENQAIVQELLHNFETRKVKSELMAIKLDLQKAYDRLNWSLLKMTLSSIES